MIRRVWSKLDILQQARMFKIIASCVVVLLGVAGFVSYSIAVARDHQAALAPISELERERQEELAAAAREAAAHAHENVPPGAPTPVEVKPGEQPKDAYDATISMFRGVVAAQHSTASVGAGIAIGVGLLLVVIWLGMGVTYLLLAVVCGLAVLATGLMGIGKQTAPLAVGVVGLAAAFIALMKLLGLLLSGPGPVFAIARTVLSEAVRLRVPVVFIVLLLFGLAALPLVLDPTTPLRYRVQAFMQYATGGAFWLIAILTLLFSITTVAFEQRDKQIWQTMTKPVAAWQYVLGKWLGVAALSFALLGTTSTGVFLFVEYLRRQPAVGETVAFKPTDDRLVTEDRMILETQVLTARRTVQPNPPDVDPVELEKAIQERIDIEFENLGTLAEDPALARERRVQLERLIRDSLQKNLSAVFRTIDPGQSKIFEFSGLQEAKRANVPVTLRFSIQSGGNMPDQLYQVTLVFAGSDIARVHDTPLDQVMSVQVSPDIIDDNGNVGLEVINGNPYEARANPLSITFPPEKLELSYSEGSFRMNYLRVFMVLWVKLLFLAILAICASTFLSFPVAALVSFTTFLTAEGARYVLSSIDYFETETMDGKTRYFNTVVAKFAQGIGNVFRIYSDLRPTNRLVEGEYLSWWSLLGGTAVIGLMGVGLFVLATYIFRRRELATYSGH
ncbi:MAG TPA: hypothetical protein VHN77_12050 [Phycisphaerales bacterium]|nr:hypothetical protein [Phycisphaerales bacterium]